MCLPVVEQSPSPGGSCLPAAAAAAAAGRKPWARACSLAFNGFCPVIWVVANAFDEL